MYYWILFYVVGCVITQRLIRAMDRFHYKEDYDWDIILRGLILSLSSWLGVMVFGATYINAKLEKLDIKPPKWL